MSEIWKDIKNFPGYQVSDDGKIRSHNKTTYSKLHGKRLWSDRILKQKVSKSDGRARVCLWRDGASVTVLVHRVQAIAFIGDPPTADMTVNHKDGNPLNNTIENLEWVTRSQNIRHGFANGLYSKNMKPVELMSEFGEVLQFESASSASRYLGRSYGYIYAMSKSNKPLTSTSGVRYSIV